VELLGGPRGALVRAVEEAEVPSPGPLADFDVAF
jgi:hypothetical protein